MKCDYVGIELLKIAAFLFAARYITAALFIGPGLKNWNSALFDSAYRYVGSGLTIGAGISVAAGIAMLIVAAKKKTA